MSEARPVVVIDDDPDIRDALQGLLETVDLQGRALLFRIGVPGEQASEESLLHRARR